MNLTRTITTVFLALIILVTPVFGCPRGYYKNSQGRCVLRPVKKSTAPEGATAKCGDGSYSFSRNRRGTCSHHGGVAQWLN
jgi:hypothetical protein